MIDSQRNRIGLIFGHREKRYMTVVRSRRAVRSRRVDRGWRQVNVVESRRALPKLGRHFEDDVILIQLRVDDGYFRLTECIVEGGIKRLHRQPELRGSHTVEGE